MKKVTALLLCFAVLLPLAACGGSGSGGSTGEPTGGVGEPTGGVGEPTGGPAQDGSSVSELEKKYSGLKKDDLKWEYNSAARTVVISGEGPMRDYGESAPEWDRYSGEAEKVIIGDKVTSVSTGAFLWFSAITEVQLGQSVEFIGAAAFSDCYCLRTVNFPASLKYIGPGAFNNDLLHSDSGFSLPEGMLYLGEEAFRSAFKENTVTIPASLSEIGPGAFANCFVSAFVVDPANPAYTSVDGVLYDKDVTTLINYPADKSDKLFEIPGSVKTISAEAIEVTHTLEKITIPASVTEIGEGAIFWNYALSSIDVDPGNTAFRSVDGVLFSGDGKKLLAYPIASGRTEYTIPEGTEKICPYALSQASALTELHTGESLREIGEYALYLCPALSRVGLPGSLERIDECAFACCGGLTEIRYAGKGADWKNVTIGEGNDLLSDGSVRIYCAE